MRDCFCKFYIGFNVFLATLLNSSISIAGEVNQGQQNYNAAQKTADSLLLSVNAGNKYLLIASLLVFLMGVASFLPGIRKPGWGMALIFFAILLPAAPSCVNWVTVYKQ